MYGRREEEKGGVGSGIYVLAMTRRVKMSL